MTFFATVIAWHGSPAWLPDPTMLFTFAGLAGVLVSITGNESAQRWGRSRVVLLTMSAAAALSVVAGGMAAVSTPLAVIVMQPRLDRAVGHCHGNRVGSRWRIG